MPHTLSFERDIGPLRRLLDDAFKGLQAAEDVLFHHSKPDARLTAINFPLEEGLLREAVGLLADGKAQAAAVLRRLDAETRLVNLQFERLFDDNAGRQTEGFFRRRVHLGHVAPEAIAATLVDLLSLSAALDRMLKQARPVLAEHHRNCEAYLLRLAARRQRVDVDLEDVSRRIASMKTQGHAGQTISVSWRSPASTAASEEERQRLALDRQAASTRAEILQSEWETLQRMIADDEGLIEAINGAIAAADVMAFKLAVDIEQRLALLQAANIHSSTALSDVPAPVQAQIAAFDANILAGHDLLARQQRADEAFSRRMAASLPASEQSAEAAGDTDIAPAGASPPI